ncbi:MAG: hypothetical protein JO353_10645, partial [Phycisphaerae bacterium]|nr:hypothetical protein [Phycisphaerae bacterium]
MRSVLLRLIGLGSETRHVTDWHFTMRSGSPAAMLLLIALFLCVGAVTLYRRETIERPMYRRAMTLLRSLLFIALVGLLLEPRIVCTVEATIRRSLLVLIDQSSSMKIEDPRIEQDDLARAAIAMGDLDPAGGLKQSVPENEHVRLSKASRASLVQSALNNHKLDLIARLSAEQDLRPFGFADKLADLGGIEGNWVDQLRFDGRSTALGDSLRDVMARTRGQPLSGILLITDGANNAGASPAAAAELAGRAHAPLFIWGVGLPSSRDIIVTSVYTQDVAFVEDQVTATVRVRSNGYVGQSGDVILKLNDTEVARQSIQLNNNGEQIVQLQFTPKQAGDFKLTAMIPPREDEVAKDNNEQSTSIRIVDGKLKVLLIDRAPRWEFKYLQAMLLRDRRVELKCFLQDADPGMSAAKDSIYIPDLPADRKDLFRYDVILIGDMNMQNIVSGQLEAIKQYVGQFGGGVVFIAGAMADPQSYRGTPLADLLPVELPASASEPDRSKPIHPDLTVAGREAHMLRLADTEAASNEIWAQLPPVFFDAVVGRAKPGAEVLAIDPDPAKATQSEKMPLFAIQQYGVGSVLYIGTDDTWRWRKNVGDKYYTLLWGQIIQRLALPHLLGE